ncbi:MAG TPA: ABC transporter permease [Terriglobia bacterium]|nr:ABC transporter permease [Terriglobia bacterium]
MASLRILLSKLSALFRKARLEQQLDEDVRAHLNMLAEENLRKGMTTEEARYAARREFGNIASIKEECRERWSIRIIEELVQDLRYGLRQLRRNPGFTAVAVLTLALGIGANTAIFSVVDTVLLRPLPYKDASRLLWATERFPFNHGAANVVSPDFIGWKDRNQAFEQIGAAGGAGGENLTGAGPAIRVSITNVTTNFFSMLGVHPLLGRTFLASEGKLGNDHVALLSESLWRNQLGSDTHVLGKTIRLGGSAYTVVGVMPSSLRYDKADVWTPFALDDKRFSPQSPSWAILTVVGRLKPGVEIPQAQADLQLITRQMDKEYPPQASRFRSGARVQVVPLHELLVRNVRPLLLILLGAVGFVLLIACLNVANVLLSRGVVRDREIGVRLALGAGRGRLVRQLLTEALLLAVAGGALGCLAGLGTTKILSRLIPPNFPLSTHPEVWIFTFTAFVAALTVVAFGLVPALLASRREVNDALKEGNQQAGLNRATHRLRGLMAAAEIALSLILLVGAGLLMRSLLRLTEVSLGFDPHALLIATVQRTWSSNPDAAQGYATFFQSALEKVQNLPGVRDAAVTSQYPLGPPHNGTTLLNIKGRGQFHTPQVVMLTSISPDYFRTMAMPLLKGRTFNDQDSAHAEPVAVINSSLARILFGEGNPLGQRLSFGPPPQTWTEIVGVVTDTRDGMLEAEPDPELFTPYLQQPSYIMTLVLRTGTNPGSLAGALRKAVQDVDKNQPVFAVETMDDVIATLLAPRRFRALLLGLFAMLALVLAAVGIFGVISYSVSQRTREIGIRVALGAERGDVLRAVLGQGLKLALIGVGVGIAGALALTRFLSSMLYGVKPTDPLTFIAVSLILIAVALAACYIPARRATKIDPMVALR